jgi:peroxiredoxin Q/BCP
MSSLSFELKDQEGKLHRLADYKGQWVVIYFYPKDETPGCTIEACSIRDVNDDLKALGVAVFGISKDDQDSHKKFSNKHKLNFTILSDPNGEVIESFGAWGKKQFGMEGILRKTFIINPDGEIAKEYKKVTPLGHGQKILEDIKELMHNQ